MANISARIERVEVALVEQCAIAWKRMFSALVDASMWLDENGTSEQVVVFDAWMQSKILTPEQQATFNTIDTPHNARLEAAIAAMDRFPTVVIDRAAQRRALAKDKVEPDPEAEMINNVT